MKLISFLFITVILTLTALSGFSQSASTILTNAGVIEMHKSGLGTDIILTSIESSPSKFNVTAPGLIALKKAGVDESVIKVMIEKQSGKAPVTTAAAATSPANKTGTTANAIKPEKASALSLLNHVYYSSSASAAKPLEKMVAGIRTKQGAFGGSILLHVEGNKSAIRINSGDAATFLINTGSEVLPELVLYKLKIVKGNREVATMKANTFSGMKTGEDVITLNISKSGNGTYKITPGKTLLAGEYFFAGKPTSGSTSVDAFAFGVD